MARKLLRDLAARGEGNGFAPRFGHEGKVLYMPGPTDTPAQVRRRMATLRQRHGDDGHFFIPLPGLPEGLTDDEDAVFLEGEAEEIADPAQAA